jgi:hypothetical protein
MLPPSPRDFKDIYVVFELMETDLHQVGTYLHGAWPRGQRRLSWHLASLSAQHAISPTRNFIGDPGCAGVRACVLWQVAVTDIVFAVVCCDMLRAGR